MDAIADLTIDGSFFVWESCEVWVGSEEESLLAIEGWESADNIVCGSLYFLWYFYEVERVDR